MRSSRAANVSKSAVRLQRMRRRFWGPRFSGALDFTTGAITPPSAMRVRDAMVKSRAIGGEGRKLRWRHREVRFSNIERRALYGSRIGSNCR